MWTDQSYEEGLPWLKVSKVSNINPLIPKISIVILLTVCHTIHVSLENLELDQPIIS